MGISMSILEMLASSLDFVWVQRWNLAWGVNDHLMALGEDGAGSGMNAIWYMTIFVLMVKVCPPGAEGSVLAIVSALELFGQTIAKLLGSLLLETFGVNTAMEEYAGLSTVIMIKSLCRLSPLLLIFLLPRSSMSTVLPGQNVDEFEEDEGYGAETSQEGESDDTAVVV